MKGTERNKPHEGDRCGAKTRAGGTCKRWPVLGRRRCRLHGGSTPVGPDSANWKTGLHSKHVPASLKGLLREVNRDPRLEDTRDDLVLVTGLRLHRLKNSRAPLNAGDEQALMALTDARLRVLTLRDKLKRLAADTLTVAQFHHLALTVMDSVRRHVGDDAARLVRDDIEAALRAGVFGHGGDVESE